jgi:hypothetical protein
VAARPPRSSCGRERRAEILCVDAIQRHEVTHAREIHTGARDIIETLAGRLENRREIPEDALCLGHNTTLDHLASGRVLADLTAKIEETTDFDRLGKRADRRREFGRGNCGLVHGIIHRLLAGELDVAAVLLPEGKAAPPPLRSDRRLRICLTA